MRLLRPTSLRIRSTLRSPDSADRKRKESQRSKGAAPRIRDATTSATTSVSTSTSQDTSARTLQNILSFRPVKPRIKSEVSTETVSGDETGDDAAVQLDVERKRWKLSSAQMERKVDVLQDEVGRLKDEIAQQRAEVDRVTRERNDYKRRLRRVEDEEGSGSTVQGLKREVERVRWCAAWFKVKTLSLQRRISEATEEDDMPAPEGLQGEEWDDVVGETVMSAIQERGAGVGLEGWEDCDDGETGPDGWKDQEIARLEELLKEEFGTRVELEGMVEEMAEALHRRDEEERRASEYLEGRWRRAEEDLRALLHSEENRRPRWNDHPRRVTTAVDGGDHFWM